MSEDFLKDPLSLFSVKGKTAIVTGATGRLGRANGAPAERGMEGFGNDREVGQFGHGGDCSRVNACARLSRPREAGH